MHAPKECNKDSNKVLVLSHAKINKVTQKIPWRASWSFSHYMFVENYLSFNMPYLSFNIHGFVEIYLSFNIPYLNQKSIKFIDQKKKEMFFELPWQGQEMEQNNFNRSFSEIKWKLHFTVSVKGGVLHVKKDKS